MKTAEVKYEGQTIILPEKMSIPTAIENLQRRHDYESQTVVIIELVEGFLWDGAIAFQKAMEKTFGWVFAEKEESFFGSKPPKMLPVTTGTGRKDKTLVPWGTFTMPGIEGRIQTAVGNDDKGRRCLQIVAEVKRKHEAQIRAIADLTRQYLAAESIYRGKAIKLTYEDSQDPMPSFINLDGISEKNLVYSAEVDAAIKTSLFTPIEKAPQCRELKIPLKRGILLSGPYGTGKTLAAYVSAKKAVEAGFTFIYCHKASEFSRVVEFAAQYQPAVIFCEDIDRVTAGERSVELDDVLNIIDGIESKHTEIMVVLTTNHVERINPAMLRPGRLDAVINVLPPDAEAVEKLVRLYAGNLLDEAADLKAVGEALAGNIPAVIRECVERSKLAALRYQEAGMPLMITGQALTDAAASMQNQLDLLRAKSPEPSTAEKLGLAVAEVVKHTVSADLADIAGKLENIEDHTC